MGGLDMVNDNRFRQGKQGLLFLILAAAIWLHSPAMAVASGPGSQIEFLDSRLSIYVENVPLGSVLGKIYAKVGVEFIVGNAQYEDR